MPKRSTSATREVSFDTSQNLTNRAQSPSGTSRSPARTINVRHEYSTESSGHTSRRDSPSMQYKILVILNDPVDVEDAHVCVCDFSGTRNRSAEMSSTLRGRTPSPSSGEFRPSNFSNYPISPKDLTPTRTVTKSYNYSTSSRRTPTPTTFDEPQPYRSPSPVSFPQKRSPSPSRRSLNRSDSGRTVSYQVSCNPCNNNFTYRFSFEFDRLILSIPQRFHLKPLKNPLCTLISLPVTRESRIGTQAVVVRIGTSPCRDLFLPPLLHLWETRTRPRS